MYTRTYKVQCFPKVGVPFGGSLFYKGLSYLVVDAGVLPSTETTKYGLVGFRIEAWAIL